MNEPNHDGPYYQEEWLFINISGDERRSVDEDQLLALLAIDDHDDCMDTWDQICWQTGNLNIILIGAKRLKDAFERMRVEELGD